MGILQHQRQAHAAIVGHIQFVAFVAKAFAHKLDQLGLVFHEE